MSAFVGPLCALWLGIECLRQVQAWWVVRRQKADSAGAVHSPQSGFDGVDVLQAVRSGDPLLAETLAAVLAELGRRGARLHWLVDADDAAAQAAAQQALNAHPQWSGQVRLGLHPRCPERCNPKLFKLARALPDCERDYVLVLDDDAELPAVILTGDTEDAALGQSGTERLRVLYKPVKPAELRQVLVQLWRAGGAATPPRD